MFFSWSESNKEIELICLHETVLRPTRDLTFLIRKLLTFHEVYLGKANAVWSWMTMVCVDNEKQK